MQEEAALETIVQNQWQRAKGWTAHLIADQGGIKLHESRLN